MTYKYIHPPSSYSIQCRTRNITISNSACCEGEEFCKVVGVKERNCGGGGEIISKSVWGSL